MDAAAWDARYRTRELVWGAGPNRAFAATVAGLPAGRALDLGCGEGRNAIWLAEQGWRVTAVDFSGVALDRARDLAVQRGVTLDLQREDLRAWVPPSQAFDLVAVLYLHLPSADLRRVHARAADAVAPGGTLVVVGHDRRNLAEGHGGPRDPAWLLSPDEVVADLVDLVDLADLEVVRAATVTRAVDTDPPATALDTLVHVVRPG